MAETKLLYPVFRCKVHNFGTASWYELIGVCGCVHTRCVTADDGYHLHEVRVGDDAWSRTVVTEHLHTWMEAAAPIDVQRGKNDLSHVDGTLADAWRQVTADEGMTVDLPAAVPCRVVPTTGVTVVSGPHPWSPTMRRCDVGGHPLPAGGWWWLIADPGAGWRAGHGAACGLHLPEPVAVPGPGTARATRGRYTDAVAANT
jgi:hypothetical protein